MQIYREDSIRADSAEPSGVVRLMAREEPSEVWVDRLAPGTAALVTRLYARVYVSISDRVPAVEAERAVRHVVEDHPLGCFAHHCPLAREWVGAQTFPKCAAVGA